ncbi:hypothetical protein F4805DRAFT_442574 [Annulohypoxylon moriforme]|nr:hypothetical protein F4805DRAFT_442574 [Annulohypoxylon moriforme]
MLPNRAIFFFSPSLFVHLVAGHVPFAFGTFRLQVAGSLSSPCLHPGSSILLSTVFDCCYLVAKTTRVTSQQNRRHA